MIHLHIFTHYRALPPTQYSLLSNVKPLTHPLHAALLQRGFEKEQNNGWKTKEKPNPFVYLLSALLIPPGIRKFLTTLFSLKWDNTAWAASSLCCSLTPLHIPRQRKPKIALDKPEFLLFLSLTLFFHSFTSARLTAWLCLFRFLRFSSFCYFAFIPLTHISPLLLCLSL